MRTFSSLCLMVGVTLAAIAADAPDSERRLIVKPSAFKTLVNPDCSHCRDEAKRRAKELRDEDTVLCWIRDTKGKYDGGAIPYRFFLNPYRVISDSYGVFVYDPDAGFARGFAPSFDFTFHGWRNGVMIMKDKKDNLYSCLTGVAFAGPDKGKRLKPVPTVVSTWGYWLQHYPDSVAYRMYDKYIPVELPSSQNEDAIKSRLAPDRRLPAEQMVLGVVAGPQARAYSLDALAKSRLIRDELGGQPIVVAWEPLGKTAVAYRPKAIPPDGVSAEARSLSFHLAQTDGGKVLTDKETRTTWDIAGRGVAGELKGWTLEWVDSTQVKWFAWAAEHPETSIYQPKE